MYELMDITEESIEKSKKIIFEVFDEASEKIASNSNSLTTESSFSPTDLAFCALGSIAVFPQNYSRNVISMGNLEDFPEEYQNIINHCRKTLAGKFITETYNSKRL